MYIYKYVHIIIYVYNIYIYIYIYIWPYDNEKCVPNKRMSRLSKIFMRYFPY